MKKLLIISAAPSDLSDLLSTVFDAALRTPEEACFLPFDAFDAVCVLGGVRESPLILPIDARISLEAFHGAGKPVFIEYCGSFADTYTRPAVSDVGDRMV